MTLPIAAALWDCKMACLALARMNDKNAAYAQASAGAHSVSITEADQLAKEAQDAVGVLRDEVDRLLFAWKRAKARMSEPPSGMPEGFDPGCENHGRPHPCALCIEEARHA